MLVNLIMCKRDQLQMEWLVDLMGITDLELSELVLDQVTIDQLVVDDVVICRPVWAWYPCSNPVCGVHPLHMS